MNILELIGFCTVILFIIFIFKKFKHDSKQNNFNNIHHNDVEDINKNKYHTLSLNSKLTNREKSLNILAKIFNCEIDNIKDVYQQSLIEVSNGMTRENKIYMLKQSISEIKKEKHNQSIKNNIKPDDTPAGIMESFMNDLLLKLENHEEFSFSPVTIIGIHPSLDKTGMIITLEQKRIDIDDYPRSCKEWVSNEESNSLFVGMTLENLHIQCQKHGSPQWEGHVPRVDGYYYQYELIEGYGPDVDRTIPLPLAQ